MSRPGKAMHDPVSLVLGPTGPGPFALLGLPATDVGIQEVLAALHVRLEQIKASPHAATPVAEDVRLALHAAAAQLCDPAVRRLLVGTWGPGARTSAPAEGHPVDLRLLIERDLHIAVGLSGGWNAAAMQRLALACEDRGVSVRQLGQVIDAIARQPSASHAVGRGDAQRSSSARRVSAATADALPRELLIAIVVGAALVVSIVSGLIIFRASRLDPGSSREVVATLERGIANSPLKLEPSKPAPDPQTTPELSISDARSIDRELGALTKALVSEADAGTAPNIETRLQTAFDAFSANWHLLRKEEITAVVSSLIDLSFAAAQRQRDPEIVRVIATALQDAPTGRRAVRSFAAAGAIASRLLQERDLPRSMRDELETALRSSAATRALGPNARFEAAIEQIVTPLADALANGASWADLGTWKGFLDVRDAAFGDRSRAKDLVTIVALRGVLRSASVEDPEQAITLLAGALSWEKTPDLRGAIRSWFDDPGVPTQRVAALTRAMVKSPLRGVDSTMTLPDTASREDRQRLAQTVALVLRDETNVIETEVVAAWVAAADQLLARKVAGPAEAIDLAAQMAELIAIRQAQLDGRASDLSGRLETAVTPTTLPPPVPLSELPSPAAASLAIEYAAVGISQAARVEFWKKRLTDRDPPDTLLARVAIEEASRGSPAAVRDAARDYVRARSGDRAILIAALELLFAVPESRENADWLSEVAGRRIVWSGRGPTREAAHRALLEMAAERFPAIGVAAAIDAASLRLGRAWSFRIGEMTEDDAVHATDAIRRVALPMLSIGGRGIEGEVRRRLDARLSIARGVVQTAVWWQAAVVELTASDIAKRSPRTDVPGAIEKWQTQRRSAATAFEQLLAGERVQLMMLRQEAGDPSGGGT